MVPESRAPARLERPWNAMITIANDARARLSKNAIDAAEVIGMIEREAGALPQIELAYEPDLKLLWLTLRPQPKPVFTYDMVSSVVAVQRAIWSLWGAPEQYNESPVCFLAFRNRGPIATLGGDLDFYLDCLAKGDRAGLAEYARVSVESICWNASSLRGAAITLSTMEGKAFGGGIDAYCSCNVTIAEKQVTFRYPEVKFNHFPITGVSVLSRRVGPRDANTILVTGDEYTAEQFAAMGGLDATPATGEGESWLRRYAAETLPIHVARLALFRGFHNRLGDFEAELQPIAQMWTESMMRLTPMQIWRLQRLVHGQERMLQSTYAEVAS
jgi:DSF synthase